MLTFLPAPIQGMIHIIILFAYTGVLGIFLFPLAILKILIPIKSWRKLLYFISLGIANIWMTITLKMIDITMNIKWDFSYSGEYATNEWYLVLSNHKSWIDIIVLMKLLHKKIPFLKFFLKRELGWIPIFGMAWWMLEYPFMKRYSKDTLEKKPHLKGKDLEITKKACEKFKNLPLSVMNFPEGTRFTNKKHKQQHSQYENFLKPRAGGISYVINSMNGMLHKIVDVSIFYPQERITFWNFLCGRLTQVKVNSEVIDIPDELVGNYLEDDNYRTYFQNWLNVFWYEKDKKYSKRFYNT